jgi:hypothetical protein
LPHILDQLAQRVGLAVGATVAVDRGLASAANIAVIQQRKLHYVVAARQSERDQWLANFDDHPGFTLVLRSPSPTNPGQKKSRVDVHMKRRGDLVYVLCRVANDRAIRQNHERRLLVDIDCLQRRVAWRAGVLANAIISSDMNSNRSRIRSDQQCPLSPTRLRKQTGC